MIYDFLLNVDSIKPIIEDISSPVTNNQNQDSFNWSHLYLGTRGHTSVSGQTKLVLGSTGPQFNGRPTHHHLQLVSLQTVFGEVPQCIAPVTIVRARPNFRHSQLEPSPILARSPNHSGEFRPPLLPGFVHFVPNLKTFGRPET